MKGRSPVTLMDVRDMKLTDEDGFSIPQHDDQANSTILKECIRINRVASEIVFQPFASGLGRSPTCTLDSYLRDITGGMLFCRRLFSLKEALVGRTHTARLRSGRRMGVYLSRCCGGKEEKPNS